jgi:hypothetical protein
MSQSAFPPTYSQPVQQVIPAYPYGEYADDDNVTSFFDAANELTQNYVSFFYGLNLPIYTQASIAGDFCDWVINGIYGLYRQPIQTGVNEVYGPINTFPIDTLDIDGFKIVSQASYFLMSDDIFKRCLTWAFYKGDGRQFSIPWLKRRIMRFLNGTNGMAPPIDQTYTVSVTLQAENAVTITIPSSNPMAQMFQVLVQNALLELPFQFSFTVVLSSGNPTYLGNNGGTLYLLDPGSWPSSSTTPGAVYSNGGECAVVPGVTPNPSAPAVYYGSITSFQLLVLGGGNLPLTQPTAGSGQLWNNGGVISIA